MKKLSLLAIFAASAIYAAPVAKVDIGYTGTTGDADTSNAVAKLSISNNKTVFGKAMHCDAEVSAFFAESENKTVNEEYSAFMDHKINITDAVFGYTNIDWLKNSKKKIDNRTSVAAGVGYDFMRNEYASIGVSVGAGYMWKDYTNEELDNFGILDQSVYASLNLNPDNKAILKVSAKEDMSDIDDNYIAEAALSIDNNLMENVTLSVGEYISYDHKPAAGAHRTNTKTIVSVGYTF